MLAVVLVVNKPRRFLLVVSTEGALLFMHWSHSFSIFACEPWMTLDVQNADKRSDHFYELNASTTVKRADNANPKLIDTLFPISQFSTFDELTEGACSSSSKKQKRIASIGGKITNVGKLESFRNKNDELGVLLKITLTDIGNKPATLCLFKESAEKVLAMHNQKSLNGSILIGINLEAASWNKQKLDFRVPFIGFPPVWDAKQPTSLIHTFWISPPSWCFPEIQGALGVDEEIPRTLVSADYPFFTLFHLRQHLMTTPFDQKKAAIQCSVLCSIQFKPTKWCKLKCPNEECFGHRSYLCQVESKQGAVFMCYECERTVEQQPTKHKFDLSVELIDAGSSISTSIGDAQTKSWLGCSADEWLKIVEKDEDKLQVFITHTLKERFLIRLQARAFTRGLATDQPERIHISSYVKSIVPMSKVSCIDTNQILQEALLAAQKKV